MNDEVAFGGHRCARVTNAAGHELLITVDKGPRIISYKGPTGRNLAVIPRAGIDGPVGRFTFHDGHRLWVAPEVPAITHLLDDSSCAVDELAGTLTVTAPDNGSGLSDPLLSPSTRTDSSSTISSQTSGPKRWTSGVGPDPTPAGGNSDHPFLCARGERRAPGHPCPGLWPYTRPSDPRISHGENELFVKRFMVPESPVPDLGASAQVYTGQGSVELETLGTMNRLRRRTVDRAS